MTSLVGRLLSARAEARAALTVDDWVQQFVGFNGQLYGTGLQTTISGNAERIGNDFQNYVWGAYQGNGVVFACIAARMRLFSEARFQFRDRRNGRPGELFDSPALAPLERPWPNGTTGDLLTRMLLDVDLAGNSYTALRPSGRLHRLRPDWVEIILGSEAGSPLDLELAGYRYHPGGPASSEQPEYFLPDEVAHFAPIPDPLATYRGMSWLTPVLRDIEADTAAANHKLKYLDNGATPNLVVIAPPALKEDAFKRWMALMKDAHEDPENKYKALYLGGGSDAKVVGSNMRQLSFKETTGAGETRIAAAAGTPAIIVGLSEGLEASTYSNFAQARRSMADGTLRPLWRNAAGSLATIVTVPAGAELWYDARDISFLQEDEKDAADIRSVNAQSIRNLTDAGFTPDSVVEAVMSGDLTLLEHSGLYSVQLQAPGTPASAAAAA